VKTSNAGAGNGSPCVVEVRTSKWKSVGASAGHRTEERVCGGSPYEQVTLFAIPILIILLFYLFIYLFLFIYLCLSQDNHIYFVSLSPPDVLLATRWLIVRPALIARSVPRPVPPTDVLLATRTNVLLATRTDVLLATR